MRHDWIIDVLADLRGVARSEGLLRLADQIDDALLVAAGEIARDREAEGACPPDMFLRPARSDARQH